VKGESSDSPTASGWGHPSLKASKPPEQHHELTQLGSDQLAKASYFAKPMLADGFPPTLSFRNPRPMGGPRASPTGAEDRRTIISAQV